MRVPTDTPLVDIVPAQDLGYFRTEGETHDVWNRFGHRIVTRKGLRLMIPILRSDAFDVVVPDLR